MSLGFFYTVEALEEQNSTHRSPQCITQLSVPILKITLNLSLFQQKQQENGTSKKKKKNKKKSVSESKENLADNDQVDMAASKSSDTLRTAPSSGSQELSPEGRGSGDRVSGDEGDDEENKNGMPLKVLSGREVEGAEENAGMSTIKH